MKLDQTIQEHADAVDAIVGDFITRLQTVIDAASVILASDLLNNLKIEGGIVAATSRNQSILTSIDNRFADAMDAAGYQKVLQEYINTFNGQFEWFDKVLADVSDQLIYPLPPVSFTKVDMAVLELQKQSVGTVLTGVIEKASARAKQMAVQSVGGVPVKQLTKQIAETLNTSVPEAQNIAETSISTFYRTITDKGFQSIEQDLPGFKVMYAYDGPLDKITRPFCTKLEKATRSGRTWSRAEIDKMDNHQLPNVFRTCGGYRCRHQWMISTKSIKEQQRIKGKPDKPPSKRPGKSDIRQQVSSQRALQSIRKTGQTQRISAQEHIARVKQEVQSKIKERRSKS